MTSDTFLDSKGNALQCGKARSPVEEGEELSVLWLNSRW